jgi:hypothetical protein
VADLALAAAMSIEDPMWRDGSLSRLAEVYARTGDIAPMVEAVRKIGSDQYQILSIAEFALATAKIDRNLARRAFQTAIESADAIPDPASRVAPIPSLQRGPLPPATWTLLGRSSMQNDLSRVHRRIC